MSRDGITAIVAIFLCVAALFAVVRSKDKCIRVMAADSLCDSFDRLTGEFRSRHPGKDVLLETQGSIILARLASLRGCDVLALSDYRLVEKMLDRRDAAWVVQFASTEMVLVYTGKSKYRNEINAGNWYDILLRKDVAYGYADPSQDPCGYFTLLCWKLSQEHYRVPGRDIYTELVNACPRNHMLNDALAALYQLQVPNGLDYTFAYKAHAILLKLPYVPLPKEVNLGSPAMDKHYKQCRITVSDYRNKAVTIDGSRILFGVSIPEGARKRELAEGFLRILFSPAGRQALKESGFEVQDPPVVPKWCGKVPDLLKGAAVLEE